MNGGTGLVTATPGHCGLELETNVREDFTITKKTPSTYYGLLLVKYAYSTSAFKFKTLLTYYAKLAPMYTNAKIIRDGQMGTGSLVNIGS